VTIVRRATPDDSSAIAEIRVETWRAAYVGVVPQPVLDGLDVDQSEQWWRRAVAAEGYAAFVAEQNDLVVGFVSVGPCSDADRTGELYAIYVRPDSWSTGAGLALMDAGVDWLAERWTEAVLWVAEHNPRARKFYERYGWIAGTSRVDEVAPGAHVPEVLYRLSGLDRR
jgi:ribosomal protein S18 acetylase RimI-like enzyme